MTSWGWKQRRLTNVQHSLRRPRSITINARKKESHTELADLDLGPIVQKRLVNKHAIEVRAIERAHVFDFKSCAVPDKLGVTTRHSHVVKKDVCGGMATRDCGVLVKKESGTSIGTFTNNKES
jgi:hypothetical protein